MGEYELDLVVIGAGSAGVRLARTAAATGARVAVCESGRMGGTCVNVGCVPKKLLAYGSRVREDARDAVGFGWSVGDVRHDWAALIRNKDAEIERLNGIYDRLLQGAGVRIVRGRGRVVGPHAVDLGGTVVTTEHIAVCTGGHTWLPELEGSELVSTSDDLFALSACPRRVVIAGGGYIAVEFASILHGYGAEVDLVYRGPLFLRGFDEDCRTFLASELRKRGIRLHFERTIASVRAEGADQVSVLSDGTELRADCTLFAVGRRPNTAGLGLEEVGVELDERGAVVVDDHYRSSVPSILALGDVIDRAQLTPVALAEAMLVSRDLFGTTGAHPVDYGAIPTAVFSHPALSACGLSEADARARGPARVYESSFRPMMHTMTGRDERTYLKLVVDDATDRVLGCHMVSPDAPEIIGALAVAMTCGATKAHLDATMGIHPTASEEFVTLRTVARGP